MSILRHFVISAVKPFVVRVVLTGLPATSKPCKVSRA